MLFNPMMHAHPGFSTPAFRGGLGDADAELVARFQGGDGSAFEGLMRRYAKELFGFCMRLTGDALEAEELAQDGFVGAFRSLREFRREASFRTWLYRIVVSRFYDRRRHRRREERRLEAARAGGRHPATEQTSTDELHEVIRGRVQALPDRQRDVLTLHVYQGFSYREIADILGCSYEDVKVCLSLARKRLKEGLREYL